MNLHKDVFCVVNTLAFIMPGFSCQNNTLNASRVCMCVCARRRMREPKNRCEWTEMVTSAINKCIFCNNMKIACRSICRSMDKVFTEFLAWLLSIILLHDCHYSKHLLHWTNKTQRKSSTTAHTLRINNCRRSTHTNTFIWAFFFFVVGKSITYEI